MFMMSLVRVRLSFAFVSVDEPKNRWFLVDTSVCRVVADLEYLIKERFDLRKILKRGGTIDLFLDEYLLPSQEKIDVIRDNDVIRVQESTLHTQSKGTLGNNAEHSPTAATTGKLRGTKRKGNNAEVQTTKRQHLQVSAACKDEEENDKTEVKQSTTSKEKSKEKMKQKSKNLPLENGNSTGSERVGKKNYEEENDTTKGKQSTTSKEKSKEKKKQKRKNLRLENGNSTDAERVGKKDDEEENDTTEVKQSTTSKEKSKEKKKQKRKSLPLENSTDAERVCKKDTKQKVAKQIRQAGCHINNHKTELDDTEFAKCQANMGKVVSDPNVSEQNTCSSSSTSSIGAAKRAASQSDEASAKNGNHSIVQVVHRHTDNERTVLSASGSTQHAEVANGPSFVASHPLGDLQMDSKNACDVRSLGNKKNNAEKCCFPRNQTEQRQPQLPVRLSNAGTQSRGSPNSSIHIRFDSDEEDDEPQVSEVKGQGSVVETQGSELKDQGSEVKGQGAEVKGRAPVVTSPRGTGRTVSHNATPTTSFDAHQPQRVEQTSVARQQSSVGSETVGGSLSYGLECGWVEQPECSKSQPSEKVPRDYSHSVVLHGPPRVGDRIAYKILELSASYTPEISDYKEGTVLGYDSKSDTVHLELTIESMDKPLGDGNVSQKFELIYEEEGEEEEEEVEKQDTPVSEEDRQVAVLWCAMREPLLLSGGTAN